jgi:hypothetical protein
MWDRRVVEKIEECVGSLLLLALLEMSKMVSLGLLQVSIWANSDCDRRYLWEELAGLLSWWNLPWCIGETSTSLDFPSERLGEAHFCPAMVEFFDFIFDQGLMDIPLVGGTFTWSNNQDPPSWSRIDRFLVSLDWEAHFLICLRRGCLDFAWTIFPILLDCGGIQGGRRYFKFENMWLKAEGFVDRVKQWWTSYHFQGSPSFILARKLKALKVDLRVWNEQVFGNVENQKESFG